MMSRGDAKPVEEEVSLEEIAAYREKVQRLLEGCVSRIGDYPLPEGVAPLLQWRPDDG